MKSFLSSLRKLDSSTHILRDRIATSKQFRLLSSLSQASRSIDKSARKGIPGISLSLCTSLLTIGTSIGIGITVNPQRSWAGACVGTYSSRSGVEINSSGQVVTSTGSNSVIGYFNTIDKVYVPIFQYTGGSNINAIATQPSTGNLFFINRATGKTIVYDPNTGTQTTLTGGISVAGPPASTTIIGATFNASGSLYVYYSNKTLIEVNPSSGSQVGATITISGIPGITGGTFNGVTYAGGSTNGDIAIGTGTNGTFYALGDTSGTGAPGLNNYTSRLYSISISGTTATATPVINSNITGLGGSAANGLAIDPATGKFYISSSLGTYELNTTTNAATQLTTATGTNDLAACGTPTPDLPTITKAFGPNNVVGTPANSTLTLTLGNTNTVPIYLISTLTDTFQSGLTVRSPNGLGGTCLLDPANTNKITAVASSNSISLLNGLKVPATGCTVTVNVTANAPGIFTNTIAAGALKTTAGNNTSATTNILTVPTTDYGDAPITGTAPNGTGTNAYGEAIHGIVTGMKLGATISAETTSIANATASGDGTTDDGISSFPTLTAGVTSYSIPAANITVTGTGTLHAWIDFNKNGTFEAGEHTSVAVTSNTLAGALNWTGITAGAAGNTFARFRFTSDSTVTASTPSGIAADGEVEDYQVSSIAAAATSNPNVLLVKRITAVNSNTTNGSIFLNSYDPETDITDRTYPYDKNVIQSGITPPNSDKWPNTSGTLPLTSTSSTFLLGARNGGIIKPKDTVEYTIYFLSAGTSEAKNVRFCDRVPANVTFLPNSFNSMTADPSGLAGVDRGIAIRLGNTLTAYTNINDNDIARYYPPLSEPGTDFPTINCGGPNTNGAVVVNLRDRLNATGTLATDNTNGAYGFVRFRGQVK